MIISRTPYRISFFGGGTDYREWYLEEGGAVLSTTIDKYCYLSCRWLPPFFGIKHRVVWSHIEAVSTISEILHPAVREGLRILGFDDSVGLEIHHQGDLPARAGIGSSSSFSVGLIKALLGLQGRDIDRHGLALRAIELEQDVLKEHVGAQDQVAAAYGGFNRIRFQRTGEIEVEPLGAAPQRLEELRSRLLLYYTGASRLSSEVAKEIVENLPRRREVLLRMRELVDEAVGILRGDADLDSFGRLLDEGWRLKRGLGSRVSSPRIDGIYDAALRHGALGGKLLGAGGTGFMMFYAPPERHGEIREAFSGHVPVPFEFETHGSAIIYSDPECGVGRGR